MDRLTGKPKLACHYSMIVGLPAHASYGLPSAANFRIAGDTLVRGFD